MEHIVKQIHLIGNAHIDIMWLWDWNEGIQTIRSTFSSALDRIDENELFIFTSACAYYYQVVERADPSLFKRIQKAVANGRWHITGGWWLQPDCNAPSGESFVRQGLYGQHYFLEKFGKIATSGYNVDSFGHNGNLPQLLKKMGLNHYVFMRPGKSEKDLPSSVFEWVGIDGSSVVTFRIPPNYNNSSDWGDLLDDKISMIQKYIDDEKHPLMAFYGVGNHGGGPTKENLMILDKYCEQDASIIYSDVAKYFEDLSHDTLLDVVKGDLQFHAIGCYSAYSEIKQLNNKAEQALMTTEKILSILNDQEGKYEEITRAWKQVLRNQFHDTLGGCSIPHAYEKVKNSYGAALEIASDLTTYALQKLVVQIKTFDSGSTLIVFNPHPWQVIQSIELNVLCDQIIDLNGNLLDFEVIPSDSIGHSFTHHTRVVVTLPPLGYTSYHIVNPTNHFDGESLRRLQYPKPYDDLLESENLKVTIDPERGIISSIKNLRTQKEYLGKEGIVPVLINDNSDTWSHGLHAYNGLVKPMELNSFTLISNSKVSSEYELVYTSTKSRVILRLVLLKKLDTLDFHIRIQFNEEHKLLAFRCSIPKSNDIQFKTEIPNGSMHRVANGNEYPIQRWVHLGDSKGNGLCVINNGVYSATARENVLQLTLLRSPIYAHHSPAYPRNDIVHKYMEFGEHNFSLRVFLTDSYEDHVLLARKALEFNQPPIIQVESIHDGQEPLEQSFGSLSGDSSLILSTIKKAEKSAGIVIRIYESNGIKANGIISLASPSISHELSFDAFEIKTLYVDPNGKISEASLLEEILNK